MTLKELAEEKANAIAKSRELLDKADAESRQLTAEETAQYDAWEKEIDEASKEIAAVEDMEKRRLRLSQHEESLKRPLMPTGLQRAGADSQEVADRRSFVDKIRDLKEDGLSTQEAVAKVASTKDARTKDLSRALSVMLLNGPHALTPALMERAGLQMDVDSSGGFLVMPELFIARLIADLDRNVVIRSLATVIPLAQHESLGVPRRETDIGDLTWTTELAVGSEDTSLSYDKRRLSPQPCARYIKVSKDLMRIAAISPEAEVRARLAYKAGTVQEAAFMTGSGANEPLGLFTASAAGISTSRDVSTGNTATSITTDGLIEAKYTLESQWLATSNLRWLFHRSAIKQIRKLKTGDGQYIWNPGITTDMTDRILDIPVVASEYAPSTFTASQYVGLLGDFSYYWIADRMQIEIQKLMELFALTNQDGFIARFSCDGMPILENAFARVKLSA